MRRAKKMAAFASMICLGTGLAQTAHAEQTLQGNQNSDSATSTSGTSNGSNSSSFNTGANSSGSDATSTQNGSGTASVSQSGKGKSGDAVAGGQVAGAVGDDVTAQFTNNADNPNAESGLVDFNNDADMRVGAIASATGTAISTMNGDADLEIAQDLEAASGDAVGGAQVVGVVGDGEHTIQVNNTADCGEGNFFCSASGNVIADNLVGDPNFNDPSGAGAFAVAGVDSTATQAGDNSYDIGQGLNSTTGDGIFGTQITGSVGGSVTLQGNNNSSCDNGADFFCAVSGNIDDGNGLDNNNEAYVQGGAFALIDDGGNDATATQAGDNDGALTQAAEAASGDAVSGGQIAGIVAGNGDEVVVQNTNNSDDDAAQTGEASTSNLGIAISATLAYGHSTGAITATQDGSNSLVNDQAADAVTGDAVAGSQITGAVAGDNADVTIQNFNSASQAGGASVFTGAEAFSGDAVAGAQITGVVTGSNSETAVQVTNEASGGDGTFAQSQPSLGTNAFLGGAGSIALTHGDAVSTQNGDNDITSSQVGNDANAANFVSGAIAGHEDAFGVTATSATFDLDNLAISANATQSGSNGVTADQLSVSASGDAVAGSQVGGLVQGSGSEQTYQGTNNADDTRAVTGDIPVFNDIDAFIGATAYATDPANATQNGGNDGVFTQDADASTGDAVGGAQITGLVGGDVNTIQVTNSADDGTSDAGDATANNFLDGVSGANADATVDAAVQQTGGDNGVAADQTTNTASGDAVNGSQITGKA